MGGIGCFNCSGNAGGQGYSVSLHFLAGRLGTPCSHHHDNTSLFAVFFFYFSVFWEDGNLKEEVEGGTRGKAGE